jgi:hypothetical protein
MRRLLPLLLLSACDTPGTFGTDLFGSGASVGPDEAQMIAELENEGEQAGTPSEEAASPPERVLAKVPPLPSSTWIQVFDRSARIAHRLHDDGRYTVQFGDGDAQAMPVISRSAPERRELSVEARERIIETLDAVGFSTIAPHLPEVEKPPSEGVMVVKLHPIAITVRDTRTGVVHTVQAEADMRVPESFGPLTPLWRTLDDEVFGRWLETAVAETVATTPR